MQCGIGKDVHIENAIIDKNVSIGNGVKLLNKKSLVQYDGEGVFIRDGIIVVPRGAVLPDNFVL
jgi:glucose-1-phosphate adenylyltransferase